MSEILTLGIDQRDIASIERAKKELIDLGKGAGMSARELEMLGKSFDSVTSGTKKATSNYDVLNRILNSTIKGSDATRLALKKLNAEYASLMTRLESGVAGKTFHDMAGNIGLVISEIKAAEAAAGLFAARMNNALGTKGFTEAAASIKTVEVNQRAVNAELEKQAVLMAQINKLGFGSKKFVAAGAEVADMQRRTESLKTFASTIEKIQNYKLPDFISTGTGRGTEVLRERLAAINKELVSIQRTYSRGNFVSDKRIQGLVAEVKALDAAIASQKSLNEQRKKEIGANQAALEAQRTKAIKENYAALVEQKKAYEQLNAVQSRLQKFEGIKLDSGTARQLEMAKASLANLNTEVANTGKMSKTAFVELNAQTKELEKNFGKSSTGVTNWSRQMQYAMGGVARSMGAMTYSYAMLGPLMAGIAFGSTIQKVYELGQSFEYSIKYIEALNTSLGDLSSTNAKIDIGGVTSEELRERLLGFKDLTHSADQLAAGMREFSKAGVDTEDALANIAEMSRFATVAEMDLSEAITLSVGQAKAFGISYAQAANIIGAVASATAADVKDLAVSMSYTTELATISKISFEEVAAAIGVLSDVSIFGSKAGTALRTAIIKMQNPSEKLKGTLNDLGIAWSAWTETGKTKTLENMFKDLAKALKGLPEKKQLEVMTQLFDIRSLKAGANLVDAMGDPEKWKEASDAAKNAFGQLTFLQKMMMKLSESSRVAWGQLTADFKNSLISVADDDALSKMIQDLRGAVGSEAFVGSVGAIVDGINSIGLAITSLINLASKLPADAVDVGLLGYMLIGKSPWGTFAAGVALIAKQLDEIRDKEITPIAGGVLSQLFGEDFNPEVMKSSGAMEALRDSMHYSSLAADDFSKYVSDLTDKVVDYVSSAGKVKPVNFSPTGSIEFGDDYKEYIKNITEEFERQEYTAREIQRVVDNIISSNQEKNLSTWEKTLKDIDNQIVAMIEREKDIVIFDPEDLDVIREKLIDNAILDNINKIKEETNKLTFDNFINSMKESEDVVKRVEGVYQSFRQKILVKAEDLGLTFVDDEGNVQLMKEVNDQLEAMVLNASDFSTIAKEAWNKDGIKGIQDIIDILAKESTPSATLAVKALQKELENLKAEAVVKLTESIEQLKFDNLIAGAKEVKFGMEQWEGAANRVKATITEIDKKVRETPGAFENGSFTEKGKEYFRELVAGSRAFENEIKSLKEEIMDLDRKLGDMKFDFAKDLREAQQSVFADFSDGDLNIDIKTAVDLKDLDKLKDAVKEAGLTGIRSRQTQYEILVKEAQLQRKMIQESNQRKQENYNFELGRIQQLIAAGEKAGRSGAEGRKEQVRLLEKALGLAEELDTTPTLSISQAELERAKQQMIKFQDAAGSIRLKTQQQYLDALAKFRQQEAGGADSTKAAQQLKLIKDLQDKIVDLTTQSKDERENELDKIEKLKKSVEEYLAGTKSGYEVLVQSAEELNETAANYGVIVDKASGKIATAINGNIRLVHQATDAWRELSRVIEGIKVPKVSVPSTNIQGKAAGGPVNAGQPYIVGEKRPELFVPKTAGNIIPFVPSGAFTSGNVVDINLSINGSEPVRVQGDEFTVDKLQRAVRERARYAA